MTKRIPKSTKVAVGRADLSRLRRVTDAEIERTSPPELKNLPPDFWVNAQLVPAIEKEAISLRVDTDVLTWFRSQGPRYQSRMNAVLRAYMQAKMTPAQHHGPTASSRRPATRKP